MKIEVPEIEEFHAWECVTLMKKFSSLNLVIKDERHMMALLHVLGRKFYGQTDNSILRVYNMLRIKMKCGYECWRLNKSIKQLVQSAIKKTIIE